MSSMKLNSNSNIFGIFEKYIFELLQISPSYMFPGFLATPLLKKDRSNHWRCSVKKDVVLKNLTKFTGNTYLGVSLLIKLHA